ncbi:hypothetical protein ACLKMH_01235 [Psychromonas sp. KJ10-10]|uniref:hypothetical protein n=1 Tax=Psychromonas sp. KJ10-10 TaxID=3391823 RepID=UPI0039B3AA61
MKKLKKQSILTFFSTTTGLLFIVVLVFNSLAIQHLIFSFNSIKANQNVFSNIHNIFTIIESNGYERGRVNVILNYQGQLDEMHEFREFVNKHRHIGNNSLQEMFSTLPDSGLKYDIETFKELSASWLLTKSLQNEYLSQLDLPFTERDLTVDDKWFNHMSKQIETLSTLTYSLIEKNSVDPTLALYAKMIYQLTMLRNHTGPVVSYLKAMTFNRNSLTTQRIEELKYKKTLLETR